MKATNEPFTPDTANIGETQLQNYLKQLEIPSTVDMTAKLSEVKADIKLMEQQGKVILLIRTKMLSINSISLAKLLFDKARQIESAERILFDSHEAFRKQLDQWMNVEKESLKVMNGNVFEDQENILLSHESVSSSADQLNNFIVSHQDGEEDSSTCTVYTLWTLFEYELNNLHALSDLIRYLETTLKEIDSLSSKINSNAKNEKKCEEWRKQIEDKQAIVHNFYKGFYFFTIPLFIRQRACMMRRFISGKISSYQSISYHLFKAAQEYFNKTGLSAEDAMEETSRIFQLLKVKPIPKLPYEGLEENSRRVISTGKGLIRGANLFLSRDTKGLIGIFDRALAITQQKSFEQNNTEVLSNVVAKDSNPFYESLPLPPPPIPNVPPPPLQDHSSDEEGFEDEMI